MKGRLAFAWVAVLVLGSASPPPPRAPAAGSPLSPPGVQCDTPPFAACVQAFAAVPGMPAPVEVPARTTPLAEPTTPPAATEPRASAGGVRVVVSLPLQKAYVFRGSDLLMTSPVSTGKRGHETPAGTFRILEKKRHHRSNRYANAPMPFMQRLTWTGIALHAGHVPGYRASHGCIRFPAKAARKLYGLTNFATEVTVTHRRPKSASAALGLT